jgi:hypothetical protein
MAAKNPDIRARLSAHPAVTRRRSIPVLVTGGLIAAAVLVGWILLVVNAAALQAEFAELQDGAVTLNQRVGSRFGVLLGILGLPLFLTAVIVVTLYGSRRWALRETGTPLRRTYRGVFRTGPGAGQRFQDLIRTRDAGVVGRMGESVDKGNLVVEGWSADADRVALVGVYEFSLPGDPGWELVRFDGAAFDQYNAIFRASA